jgi:hypothetical protein
VRPALLVDLFEVEERNHCCVTVWRVGGEAPQLLVAQSFSPAGGGFEPGLLLVPTTATLFIGAGQRIVAYDLDEPRRLWVDSAECGFWGWEQHGEVVVMSAELELTAWTSKGEKPWSTLVEPPWNYSVSEDVLRLDVMGAVRSFPLKDGPGPLPGTARQRATVVGTRPSLFIHPTPAAGACYCPSAFSTSALRNSAASFG